MKLKVTLTQFKNWSSGIATAASFLNIPSPLNQNSRLKAQLFHPPQDSRSGQSLSRSSLLLLLFPQV